MICVEEAVRHATAAGTFQAILRKLEDAAARSRPILIGIPSIGDA
jgi:hypothetical protein